MTVLLHYGADGTPIPYEMRPAGVGSGQYSGHIIPVPVAMTEQQLQAHMEATGQDVGPWGDPDYEMTLEDQLISQAQAMRAPHGENPNDVIYAALKAKEEAANTEEAKARRAQRRSARSRSKKD